MIPRELLYSDDIIDVIRWYNASITEMHRSHSSTFSSRDLAEIYSFCRIYLKNKGLLDKKQFTMVFENGNFCTCEESSGIIEIVVNNFRLKEDIQSDAVIMNNIKGMNYRLELYQTLCNNRFMKQGQTFNFYQMCSFREAGSLIAEMCGSGDYLDYYLSGKEGTINQNIIDDFKNIGWILNGQK